MRILVFGAGVIGSLYTLRFVQSGMDVTALARGERLDALRKSGLQYEEKGAVRAVQVNVIERLYENDIYDFIFVPVRYDQMASALTLIRDNRSKNIVTLASWMKCVGVIDSFDNRLVIRLWV